jgi:hypothetical protein
VAIPREISGAGVVCVVITSQNALADPLLSIGENVEVVEKLFPVQL